MVSTPYPRQSQKCLLAVTTVGCRPHVYEPDVGGWRQLRAPLHADVDDHLETCVPWGRSLVVDRTATRY